MDYILDDERNGYVHYPLFAQYKMNKGGNKSMWLPRPRIDMLVFRIISHRSKH